MSRLVIFFLVSSAIFALTHYLAVAGSLYWYYWWFDSVMHFWGGLLLGIGVHALCSLRSVPLSPTLPLLLLVITVVVVSWEVFERIVGLYNSSTYVFDTSKDIILGFGGGLLAHFILRRLYNKTI